MKKIVILFFTGICMSFSGFAQQASDILRYAGNELTGTARTLGVSNSSGALGGDYGVIYQNPASLGIYRKSEFVLSPGFYIMSSNSSVRNVNSGSPLASAESQFALDNIGMVIASKLNRNTENTFNVAIGFNRLAKYNRSFEYTGETLGSIGNHFAEQASGKQPGELDNFSTGLAYDTYVIGIEQNSLDYFSDFTDNDLVQKNGSFFSEGGMYELELAFASNIDQKLSVGLKLGVPIVSYEEEILYTERDENNLSPYFNRLEYDQYLTTTGTGFNATFGMIYTPSFPVRLGLSLETPTWFSMSDVFDTRLFFDYEDDPDVFPFPPPQEAFSPEGSFSYNLRTPWRVRAQTGILIKKNGFVSAELEYLDYGNASFNYENGFQQAERNVNSDIRNAYAQVINLKLGGEYVINKFRLRGGAGFYQAPELNQSGFSPSYTTGVGFREDNFFVDLAYRWSRDNFNYTPYRREDQSAPQPNVDIDQNIHHLLLTIGFKL